MMKLILVCCFSVFLFLILSSCDTNEPLPQGAVGLTLEDVSCTEAWITLTTGNLSNTAYIKIMGNGKLLQTLDVSATKTLLYYDTLQPNTNYEFQAFSSQRGEDVIGNKLQVTTLDTTSHNFTWQTFTFGDIGAGGSLLYDVAIIDENNIWAVGEIYMNDSLGNPDPMPYNATHWGSSDWELKKIGVTYNGNETIAPLKGIFALPTGQIIFSSGLPYLPQGNGWKLYHLWDMGVLDQNDGSVDRIWGTSINDLYFVGGKGTIVHYQNGNWTKIESGTTSIIGDAWGITNNGISTVYCTVSSFFEPQQDRKILKIVNGKVDSISWKENRLLYSCWTNSNNYLYVCGSGVYQNKSGQWLQENVPSVSMNMVRGNAANDIFIIGDFGTALHFNGMRWQNYNEDFGDLFGLTFKQNIVAFVGQKNGYGYIVIGKRN